MILGWEMSLQRIFRSIRSLPLRSDFRSHPARAILRRIRWHFRWWASAEPWVLLLDEDVEIEVPRPLGSAAMIYYQGYSEPEVARFVTGYLRPGMAFFDVGSHLGEYALLAAKRVGQSGQVHAFEPNPWLFRVLERNLRRNSATNCRASELAVGARQGVAELEVAGDPAEGQIRRPGLPISASDVPRLAASYQVQLTTLDAYHTGVGGPAIDLIKLDIEGAELDALKGGSGLLATRSPVLVFECQPPLLANFGYTPADLFGFLQDFRYQAFRIVPDQPDIQLEPLGRVERGGNFLAAKDPDAVLNLSMSPK
jgi:FkbM family methyltransferase